MRDHQDGSPAAAGPGPAAEDSHAGKSTLTENLQRRLQSTPGAEAHQDAGAMHAAAAAGASGPGSALPYQSTIQQSFGRFDLGGVQAHTGEAATEAAGAIGAEAYATGQDVVFAGTPSLHTAAHEAAHVVQQRGGVSLLGGVGEAGDPYEAHADAVADRVVRGESAETLLGQMAGGAGGGAAVQRKTSSLITSQQLISGSGAVKTTMGFTQGDDKTYQAVLTALDAYFKSAAATNLVPGDIKKQFQALKLLLGTVTEKCLTFLADDSKLNTDRGRRILEVQNGVSEELAALHGISEKVPELLEPLAGMSYRVLIDRYEPEGSLAVPMGVAVKTSDPGVESKLKTDASLYEHFAPKTAGPAALTSPKLQGKKDAPCIVFDAGRADVKRVQLYKMKEDTDKFEEVIGEGYVLATQVDTSAFTHVKQANDAPLFTRKPCAEDINQAAIGDCYLLAALSSVVTKSPDLVHAMLRDNKNGSVTVRLHDATKKPATPVYLELQKTLISGGRHSSGALWVPMLEKAYAALAINAERKKGSSSYAQLGAGGQSDVAFEVLTGHAAEKTGITEGANVAFDTSGMSAPWGQLQGMKLEGYKMAIEAAKAPPVVKPSAKPTVSDAPVGADAPVSVDQPAPKKDVPPPPDLEEIERRTLGTMASYQLFKEAVPDDPARVISLVERWVRFLATRDEEAKMTIAEVLETATRREPFKTMFDKHHLEEDISAIVLPKVLSLFPGKRGTGDYTEVQVDLYGKIEAALAHGSVVALGSKEHIASKAEGKGHSGGEEQAKGLVGMHAYSVLAVRKDGKRRFVRLRNPWGDGAKVGGGYGRVYKEGEGGALEVEKDPEVLARKQSATFDLELSDLTKRFENLHVG